MMRRSLFFGLTLVLVLAFAFLAVRGCRQEQEQPGRPIETVEKSEASATRVLQPQDLEIPYSKMSIAKDAGAVKPSFSVMQEVEILNRGSVPYKEIRLSFAYLSRAGKVLKTGSHSVVQSIRPGASLRLTDIRMDGLAESPAAVRIAIDYADIAGASQAAAPRN